MISSTAGRLQVLDLPIDRESFAVELLCHLAGTLEDVVGLEEAAGFVSLVGQQVGEQLDAIIRTRLSIDRIAPDDVVPLLVALARSVGAELEVESHGPDRLVLSSPTFPFGRHGVGRRALCMLTSSVLGSMAAQALGYAKVEWPRPIAHGAPGCRVLVHLRRTPAAEQAEGHEYFRGADQ